MDQAAKYKIPTINMVASPELSKMVETEYEKYKYWFRSYHISDELAYVVADFLINFLHKQKGIKKVAIMSENALWTKPVAEIWVQKIKEAGLELTYFDYFDLSTKDFTPIFAKVMSKGTEVILQCSGIIDASIYIKQWANLNGPIIVGSSVSSDSRFWADTGGKCVSEIHFDTSGCLVKRTEKTIPFSNRYKKVHGGAPPYTTGYTYDALFVFKEAVERAKSTDPEVLVKELEKTDYVGTAGRYVYLPNHNLKYGPGFRQLPLVQWREGAEQKCIWPPELRNAEFIYPPWYKK